MAISNVASGLRPGICTSTTRPSSPYEGQMIYETDTDMVALWNGSAWRYIAATTPTNGTVLQVVTAEYSTQDSTTSATHKDSGLTANITPKSSSSKILVFVVQNFYTTAGTTGGSLRIVRGSTTLTTLDDIAYASGAGTTAFVTPFYLDSPATTSSTTYKTQFARNQGSGTVYVQTVGANNTARIVLMELAG